MLDFFFLCLFAIHITFMVKCLFTYFARFKNQMFVLLSSSFEISLYILEINHIQLCDLQKLSPNW